MITPSQENERMLANILGIDGEAAAERLVQRISVISQPGGGLGFAEEIRDQLKRTVTVVNEGARDLEIAINCAASGSAEVTLYVTVYADRLMVSTKAPDAFEPFPPMHGLIAVFCACYVAGLALDKTVGIGLAPARDPFVFEFAELGLDTALLNRAIKFDDVVLVGAGAVANGFLRAARHLQVYGALTVVDPKNVGSGNPNRCLYFEIGDKGPKAPTLCQRAAADFPHLKFDPVEGTFAEIVRQRGRVRRVLVATDSRRVRRSIQKELPLEVVDASTTGIEEVIAHSHRQPTNGACLACIYRHVPDELSREREIAAGLGVTLEDVAKTYIDEGAAAAITKAHPKLSAAGLVGMSYDSLFKELCGQASLLSSAGAQVLAPFAFVSNLAGALLALELARFDAGITDSNYIFLSPWSPPSRRTRKFRSKAADCEFCADPDTTAGLQLVWGEAIV